MTDPDLDDDTEEVIIKVQENHTNDDILVFIPPDLWEYDNIADAIKSAVITVLAQIPDELDS